MNHHERHRALLTNDRLAAAYRAGDAAHNRTAKLAAAPSVVGDPTPGQQAINAIAELAKMVGLDDSASPDDVVAKVAALLKKSGAAMHRTFAVVGPTQALPSRGATSGGVR